MRVLFVAHRTPYPPDKGEKARSWAQVEALIGRGHEVHLFAFADDAQDLAQMPWLERYCASARLVPLHRPRAAGNALKSLLGRSPLSMAYFSSRQMQREIQSKVAQLAFDRIVVCSSTMVQYVPTDLLPVTIVDLIDADSEKWREFAAWTRPPLSWIYQLEAKRLRRYEQTIVTRAARVLVTTEREAAALVGLEPMPGERLQVLPTPVDPERYGPAVSTECRASLPADERRFLADPARLRVVFTGTMSYLPNIDAVCYFSEQVFPLILEREPRAEFLIVGRNPPRRVADLSRRPGVTVTGTVRDARPYLAAATAYVAPLRLARGTQYKVLEAMATGCAVIATPIVAAGLLVNPSEHLLVARSPRELALATLDVLHNARLRSQLGKSARQLVEREYRNVELMARFVDLVESTTEGALVSSADSGASREFRQRADCLVRRDDAGSGIRLL